ncbi:MAG TPA: hypothetical protein VJ836_04255 [Candidatus Saccharimonadales bacterium]|nr:hypothetical protein [Candidatus Saccharimonadales bacterium]
MVGREHNPHQAFGWRPLFIREIRERAESDGLLQATHDLLKRDNVTVTAKGHVSALKNHQGGMLFIGDHSRQFEFVALMYALSQVGRTSMKNIVKFYVEHQVSWALGKVGTAITLPVYPRLLDKDRRNKINFELSSRIIFRRSLQVAKDARRLTNESLAAASKELSLGGSVNIFPCGGIVDSMKKPWRKGVGQIVHQLPKEDRDDVLVIPYHADNINRARLVAAVAARGCGVLGRPQGIDIIFGQPQTAAEIMDGVSRARQDDPRAITDVLRQQYIANFG